MDSEDESVFWALAGFALMVFAVLAGMALVIWAGGIS